MIHTPHTEQDAAIADHRYRTDPSADDPFNPVFSNDNCLSRLRSWSFVNRIFNRNHKHRYLSPNLFIGMEYEGLGVKVTQQIVTSLAGAESPRHQTDSPDPNPTTEGGIPDQGDYGPKGDSPGGPDGDKPDTENQESEVDPLPMDNVFEILKNSRRRQTLQYLNENGGKASLSELAEHIAAIENDCSVKAISSSQRKRVYVGLYQCHLPKMDDMHVIDFEKNRGTVELGPNATQLKPYLGETRDFDWYRLYLGLTVVAIGMVAVSLFGAAPLGLTPLTILVALLVVMLSSAVAQAYFER